MDKALAAIKEEAFEPALHTGLRPVVDPRTRLLVLGSFPSASSLSQQQYYAHPRNQFWPLLAALWPQQPLPSAQDYTGRCEWLLARGLGLWDVYAACERQGSLDSAIRRGEINDFVPLFARCPKIVAVAHNGGESARLGALVQAAWVQTWAVGAGSREMRGEGAAALGAHLSVHRLPSTSPAYAAMPLEGKREAWRALLGAYGLL